VRLIELAVVLEVGTVLLNRLEAISEAGCLVVQFIYLVLVYGRKRRRGEELKFNIDKEWNKSSTLVDLQKRESIKRQGPCFELDVPIVY